MTTHPLKFVDVTFRDGHQSSLATRMRLEDMVPLAPDMGRVGFYAMEVWGGATFDVTTRFLNEDPWERVRTLKKLLPNTPLQMLLRGQNLVGYRHYADDVVRAFVRHAAEAGIDIFRIFDALNDERNLEVAMAAVKECGKHAQAAICYSLTELRMGGPVFNRDYYVNKALLLQGMGADSICIKDMAALIAPQDAYDLVRTLKATLRVPVNLHTHYTSGMGSMSLLRAADAGVDQVDVCLAPFALRSSLAAVEPLVVALQGTERDTGLDLQLLARLGQALEAIAPKYRDYLDNTKMSVIDTGVLLHQIPGGMTSNFINQLKQAEALDRLPQVYRELARTRRELGYPPLVTPTSQIVGTQAVQNVLFGRYQMVTSEVKDYAYGLYGRPPVPMDPEVRRAILKGYPNGETPVDCRPGEVLPPGLPEAEKATQGLARDLGDVLIYALFPTTGLRFLRWKYGLEAPPPDTRPKTLADIKREDELIARAKAGKLGEKEEAKAPPPGVGARTFKVYVGGEAFEVAVEPTGRPTHPTHPGHPRPPAPSHLHLPEIQMSAPPAPAVANGEVAIAAPMPGMVIRYEMKEGDRVRSGQTVVVLEAMKMQNNLPSPADGTVKQLKFAPGASVTRGQVLAIIATA